MGTENVAESTYQRGVKLLTELGKPAYESLQALIENTRELKENKMVKMILNWKDNGGKLFFNLCDDSIANELKHRLKEERVPYITYSVANQTKSGVLFREKDQEKVEALRREILIERGGFLQEVPKSELFCASLHENVATVKDLNEEELEVMKNKSWSKGKGFSISTEKQENGKYSLYVRSVDLYKSNSGHNFLDAAARTAFSLYGNNKEQKLAEIKYDKELKEKMFNYNPEKGKMFIVSATDKTRYIELNELGFEYHKRNQDVHSIPITADRGSKNYNTSLQQAFSAMENCVMVTEKEFGLIESGNIEVEQMRPQREKKNMEIIKNEKEFQKEFLNILKDNVEEKSLTSRKSKTELYREEFRELSEMVCSKKFKTENIQDFDEKYVELANYKEKFNNDMHFLENVSENFIDMTKQITEKEITEKDYSLNNTDRFAIEQGEAFKEKDEELFQNESIERDE